MSARIEKELDRFSKSTVATVSAGRSQLFFLKCFVFFLALAPCMTLIVNSVLDRLGANPVEALIAESGVWSLRFLLISLSLTPIRMLFGLNIVNKFRRMLGLYAFFYCSVHLLIYIIFEHGASLAIILEDITKSPIVQVGIIAYIMLVPLAITSTQDMMRRLGKRWKKLHNLVHIVAILAILHFLLSIKADITEPLIYGLILLFLQGVRGIYRHYRRLVQ